MKTMIKYLYALMVVLVSSCEGSITWVLATKHVVFGNEAKLTCYAHACPQNSAKKWFRGKYYDLLCLNGISANPAKYAMMFNDSDENFDLMIKNFSLTDTNCIYTCSCGFQEYTDMLKLDDLNFIYPPKVYRYSNISKDTSFEIDISMHVFPLPICASTFEDIIVLPRNKSAMQVVLEGELLLYRIDMQYILDTNLRSCRSRFDIICNVGLLNYTLVDRKLDLCKGKENTKHNKLIYIFSMIGSGILLAVSIMLTCIMYRKLRKTPFSRYTYHKGKDDINHRHTRATQFNKNYRN